MEKCRILVADDEPIERRVVCKNIQNYFEEEVEICQATNGFEAVEIFQDRLCQIALLDITMPGMNGLDAAEQIRKLDPDCSIIFLTAYDEFEFAKRAIRVRALDYLLKPGTKEELIAVLEEAIRLSHLEKKDKSYSAEEGFTIRSERMNSAMKSDRTDIVMESDKIDSVINDDRTDFVLRNDKMDSVKNQIFKEQIFEYIEKHYMEDISLQDAASQLNYSDPYFCRFFKQNFDKNFIMYLTELRVEKAKVLLADMTINIRDIGQRVGFRDSGYFTKVFKRIVGMTPSEYRLTI